MFQPTPKRCFTIESLVAKDSPALPASRAEDPIRPAALSYANSSPMNPFLNGFHSGGRGVYSNPDLVFAEAVSHPPNPAAVPVHPVPPPHALAAHPLPSSPSPHPLFASQQRDPSTFYPWLIHRYRYLGHRFQGNETSPESFLLHNALARKPKRIRTAFSPSQLLRLEHAFEKNHYVVGAERKQLAHSLSLTETQMIIFHLKEELEWNEGLSLVDSEDSNAEKAPITKMFVNIFIKQVERGSRTSKTVLKPSFCSAIIQRSRNLVFLVPFSIFQLFFFIDVS